MASHDMVLVLDDWLGRALYIYADGGTLLDADAVTLRRVAMALTEAVDVAGIGQVVAAVAPNEYDVDVTAENHFGAFRLVVILSLRKVRQSNRVATVHRKSA